MRSFKLILAVVAGLAPGVSVAAPAGTAVVMAFPPDEGLTDKFIKKLDRALEASVHDQGLAVLSEAETRAALGTAVGNQRRNQLMACSDPACAADLCNAVGANFIVRGRVVPLYEDTAITLTLVDGRGKVLNELQQQLKGKDVDGVSAGLAQMVVDLMVPIRPPPPVPTPAVAAAPVAPAPSSPSPAGAPQQPASVSTVPQTSSTSSTVSQPVAVQQGSPAPAEASGSGSNIAAWVLIIGGGAAVAAGGVLTGVAAGQLSGLQSQYNDAYSRDDGGRETTVRNQANNNIILPVVVGGVGVAALAVGIILKVTGSGPAQVSMSPSGGPTVALAF